MRCASRPYMRGTAGSTSMRGRALRTAAALLAACVALEPLHAADEPPAPAAGDDPRASLSEQIVRVGADDRVTVHVAGLPLADALRMLSEPSRRNIVIADGASGSVTASLYNVSFDEALKAMLVSNGLGYRKDGDFIYVHKSEELQKLADANRPLASRVFKLKYLNAASTKTLIEPLLTKNLGSISITPPASKGLNGSTAAAGSSSSASGTAQGFGTEGDALAGADALVITDYVDRLQDVARVISELDVAPQQILIESTIMRATLNEDNALGIDFTTVGGIDFASVNSISPAAQSIATGIIPQNDLNNTNFTVRTDLNQTLPPGGFTFGILKDQVGIFVRALEQITDTEVIANPKVLALNKQAGQVIVGRRDGYLTTTITETTAVQQVEFLETGTVLSFRPFIVEDGVIRMEIHPKDSTGGLTEANLPFEQTTEVTTNVMVKDGHTILIGGLFREVDTDTRGQTPLLGNIPVLGALFRRTRDTAIREEVIILLTVHLMKDQESAHASEALAEDMERFRVGMRAGLQWFGRDRLAESHYRWAVEHFARGDDEKALWDADMALNNCPRHLDATKLKERILGRRDWAADGSAVRDWVRKQVLQGKGQPDTLYDRPKLDETGSEGIEGPIGMEEGDEPEGGTVGASKPPRPETAEAAP